METIKRIKKLEKNKFGLVGKNIDYSFSRNYFNEKFNRENLACTYVNFDLQDISEFPKILKDNPELVGLNVTIPYKEAIIAYLDELSPEAKSIGAVNTIKVLADGKLLGHNTDYYGFQKALKPLINSSHKAALILGTGGASKAIEYALNKMGISTKFVSRIATNHTLSYQALNQEMIQTHQLIVNTTPLGTHPNIESYPDIPYQYLEEGHLLYDLTYNPAKTSFMKKAETYKAQTANGYKMLVEQAEKAWEIWQNN